ncbi:glycosyltransferase family 4 protein [Ectothiorhodospira variabilis]|uniref:glycosyltransferase family 4 protein n=1 Tax=Ectothiorhodospira variabilis TaxID=505694 RepID=UPI001EFB60A3|nr:glycosyltransferase family 4 protein [Ectothiorhodospira variabilis]MCG5497533.1 glycosyltransferase family 4 protein [Ectothiorhodospira variabilis]
MESVHWARGRPVNLIPKRPATILYLETGVGFGGAVISLRTCLEHLDAACFRSVVVHSLDDPKFASFPPAVKTIHLPRRHHGGNGRGRPIWQRLDAEIFRYAHHLARIARTERADLIYLNNDFIANMAGVMAGRLAGCPVVLHERNIPSPDSRLAVFLTRWISRFLAISGPVREGLLDLGVVPERITMVPEGLDLASYMPRDNAQVQVVRERLGAGAGDPLVVMAGMIMDWKGQHVLIEAAPKVLADHPRARFILIGEHPPGRDDYLRSLQQQVSALGLNDAVHFAGYQEDVPLFMQAADAVVHGSVSPEPFGRVVIEAMAMGTPILATNIGAPPEIIRDGETGFLVAPGDPAALAHALNRVLGDASLREGMGRAAMAEVAQKYSVQRHAGLIQAVFDELLTPDFSLNLYLG